VPCGERQISGSDLLDDNHVIFVSDTADAGC